MSATWDLGANRPEWKRWIKAELAENGFTQATVATVIADASDKRSKTTTISNFISGDPDTVQKWFEDHPDWVRLLEEGGMGCDEGELHRRFRALLAGEGPVVVWHPAFPEVAADEVEIPAPLQGGMGRDAHEVAHAWVADVRRFRQAGEQRALTVLAPAGRARDVAVEQLRAALADELAGEAPIPGSPGDDKTAGWEVLAASRRLPDSGRFVRLAPWEVADVRALAELLAVAGRLPETRRLALRKFVGLLGTDGETASLSLTPDLAIWLLAEVAAHGCPTSLVEMRERVTAGAWRRATSHGERLPVMGESLLDHYFAAAARRVRPEGEAGSWHVLPEQDALVLLGEAACEVAGPSAGRALVELTEEVATARGEKARGVAIDALRRALLVDPVPALVTELVEGGVLVRDSGKSATSIRAAQPQLAAMWAARGLGAEIALSAPWGALCDPDWGALIEEQARRGAPFAALQAALRELPAALEIDKALVLLRFASASPALIAHPDLTAAWATALWGVAHSFLDTETWRQPWGWTAKAEPFVSAYTRRYRLRLPRMVADPVEQVRALVPESALRLVENWATTDRDHVLRSMLRVAEETFVLDSPVRYDQWGGLPRQAAGRLIEEADRGDPACQAMLSGAARALAPEGTCRNMYDYFWRELPWDVRMDWAARSGAGAGLSFDVLRRLLEERPEGVSDSRILDVAERVGPQAMAYACRRPFDGLGAVVSGLSPEFAIAVAERMRLLDVLRFIAARPFKVAEESMPRLRDGVLFVGRLGVSLTGTAGFEPRVPLGQGIATADAHARLAAEALHRLGHPEALRARWLEAGPELPAKARQAAWRIESLARLACTPLSCWVDRNLVLDELGAFAEIDRPEHAEHALCALVRNPPAFAGLEALLPDEVPPRIERGLRGLAVLLFELPDPFPDRLDGLFSRSHYPLGRLQPGERADTEHRRIEAAKTLVLLGDHEPIDIWAAGMPADGDTPQHARAAARAVLDLIETEPAVIERCWRALVASGRTDEEARGQRWRLLVRGSIAPAVPLALVVAEMLADPDPDELQDLTHRNGQHREWLPVIQKAMITAPDPRSRARWALLTARHEPGCPELRAALEQWSLADPDPWTGGADWHRVGKAYVGGARSLLGALLTLPDPWVVGALARLFDLALQLPSGGSHERQGEPPPHVRLATFHGETPWPIDDLAEALTSRGRVDVVLDAWRASRCGPAEHWLMSWWTTHASDDDLRASLWGPGTSSTTIAFALANRGVPGLADGLERALAEGFLADWYPLAMLAPERLPEALAAAVAAGRGDPTQWRELVSAYASTADGLAVYSAALASRERIATAPPRRP